MLPFFQLLHKLSLRIKLGKGTSQSKHNKTHIFHVNAAPLRIYFCFVEHAAEMCSLSTVKKYEFLATNAGQARCVDTQKKQDRMEHRRPDPLERYDLKFEITGGSCMIVRRDPSPTHRETNTAGSTDSSLNMSQKGHFAWPPLG